MIGNNDRANFENRLLSKENVSELAAQTQLVYQRNASRFASERPKDLVEKTWLEQFRKMMPKNGEILDLGCGGGEPITSYFMRQGHNVVGLDASANMIQIARQNLPEGDWRVEDIRTFDFIERFHGIIGWNSFFHLTRQEQRNALPNIAKHLRLEGALLLTVGPQDGEVAGWVCDDRVYHASLSQLEYSDILSNLGLQVHKFVVEDPDCYGMTILLAQKQC